MKTSEVEVGKTYLAKVSGKQVRVKVTGTVVRTSGLGMRARDVTHFLARNLVTHRALEFRSAQRLSLAPEPVHYFRDNVEISRTDAVNAVNDHIGVGEWAKSYAKMKTGESLEVPGFGTLSTAPPKEYSFTAKGACFGAINTAAVSDPRVYAKKVIALNPSTTEVSWFEIGNLNNSGVEKALERQPVMEGYQLIGRRA